MDAMATKALWQPGQGALIRKLVFLLKENEQVKKAWTNRKRAIEREKEGQAVCQLSQQGSGGIVCLYFNMKLGGY